jgi:hypothetical protein
MDAWHKFGRRITNKFLVRQGDIMKGYITGVVCGLLALILWQSHPLLSIMAALPLPMIVIAFWTGAVSIRFEKS